MQRVDVLISGASAAGLAAALALDHAAAGGLRIVIIEKSAMDAAPRADARAFAISAASRSLLKTLGVWDAVAHGAQPITTIDITDSSLTAGVRPVLLTYDNATSEGEAATHIVPSALITEALRAAVAARPSITILAPAAVTSCRAGEHGAEIALGDGRTLSACLVVAAEGRHSLLREQAGIKLVTWTYGQTGIVTTVTHDQPHDGRAVQHFLPAGPFAILPLTGNRACITWSEKADEAVRILALDDDAFLAEADQRFGGRLGAIRLAGPRQSWPLDMHLARSYIASRLCVIGDAAHGVHPIAGQGLNLAFRDVAALAEVVADGARLGLDIGSPYVLERYQRWRRFDSTVSAATFDGLNRLFSNDNALVRAVRDVGLGAVDRVPALKQLFVTEAAGLSGEVPKLLRGEPV
jgi:2-octaprenyl-6-methoxyphenol hydroxylase